MGAEDDGQQQDPGSRDAGGPPAEPPAAGGEAGASAGAVGIDGAAERAEERSAPAEEPMPPPASVPLPPPAYSPKVSPAAVVSDIMPQQAPTLGGTAVTLSGDHLYRESIVRFGGEIARTTGAQEPRVLKVEAPPSKVAGEVDVTVQNPGAELVLVKRAFRYVELPAPSITAVAPSRLSPRGGEICITGKHFVAGTAVLVDRIEAPDVVLVDGTTLEVQVPPGTAGKFVDVAVVNPDGKQEIARRAVLYDERYG